jgi:hypothetical protein
VRDDQPAADREGVARLDVLLADGGRVRRHGADQVAGRGGPERGRVGEEVRPGAARAQQHAAVGQRRGAAQVPGRVLGRGQHADPGLAERVVDAGERRRERPLDGGDEDAGRREGRRHRGVAQVVGRDPQFGRELQHGGHGREG